MRIRRKLEIGFGVVMLMLAAVTGLSTWSLNHSQQATAHLESTFLQQMELARLLALVNRQMKELGEYVVMGNDEELAEFQESGQNALKAFDEWKRLIINELDDVGEHHRREELNELVVLDHCKELYFDLMGICREIIELTQEGKREEAIELLEHRVEVACDENLDKAIQEQLQDERSEITGLQDAIWGLFGFARRLTVGLAVFAFVGTGLASRIVTRAIAAPLTRLRAAAARIGQGQLDTEIHITSHDEIGELAATLNQMARDLKQTTTSMDALQCEVLQRQKAETDLEAINEELTHFAYVVSHDLKAPLRGIKLLTEWLCTDYGDQLGDEAKENLDLLQNRVERMHNLIEGVLQYSRVGRIEEDKIDVDLNALLPDIIDAIAPPEHVTVTVEGSLPTIECEPTRITQVFQNLLSNAVKYMDKPVGRIVVAHEDAGGTWTFRVTDNGPGIEQRHFDRIFKIFQTLTSRDEYESTGVGLTLVRKIVELYGGKIWLESEVGRGSTFFFTLPKRRVETESDTTETETLSCHEQAEETVATLPGR